MWGQQGPAGRQRVPHELLQLRLLLPLRRGLAVRRLWPHCWCEISLLQQGVEVTARGQHHAGLVGIHEPNLPARLVDHGKHGAHRVQPQGGHVRSSAVGGTVGPKVDHLAAACNVEGVGGQLHPLQGHLPPCWLREVHMRRHNLPYFCHHILGELLLLLLRGGIGNARG